MPLHSSSPPPLDDNGDGEAGSEEDEFGDFGGFSLGGSCSPSGFADSTDSPSSLRQPQPATRQPNCSFNLPVKQSQPTSAVNSGGDRAQIDIEGQDYNAELCVHLSNGFSERDHNSGAHIASAVGVYSPREETGFADFTVFTEQPTHPWCCGFTPLGSTERWDGRAVGTNSSNTLGEQICDPGQEVIMEPRPHCAHEAKDKVCITVKHCEKRDAARELPFQDQHQPQEAAAALDFPSEEPHSGKKESSKPGDSQRERRHSFNSIETTEVQEDGESGEDREDQEKSKGAALQTFSVCESASEASFCDDWSFECPSADLEPNVSSLASGDQTDWDETDDEEQELANSTNSDSFANNSMADLRQSKAEKGFQNCDQSATQETSTTSNQSQSGTYTEDGFADFKDCSFEHHRDQEHVRTADAGVQSLGNLPPSDSFADFCSAPTQEDGERSWAEFKDQRAQEEGRTWTQFREQVSSQQTDGGTEEVEDEDRAGQYGGSRRNSCQVGDI